MTTYRNRYLLVTGPTFMTVLEIEKRSGKNPEQMHFSRAEYNEKSCQSYKESTLALIYFDKMHCLLTFQSSLLALSNLSIMYTHFGRRGDSTNTSVHISTYLCVDNVARQLSNVRKEGPFTR